jgi:hypothetical protein
MALYYDTGSAGTTVTGGTTMNPNLLPLLFLLGAVRRRDRHLGGEIANILTNPPFGLHTSGGVINTSGSTTASVHDLVTALDELFRAREGGQTFRLELLLPFLLTSAQASAATSAPTTTPAPAPVSDPTTLALLALALADDRP